MKRWEMVTSSFKNLETVKAFKFALKKCVPKNCPCRLCKRCMSNKMVFYKSFQKYILYLHE